MGTLRGSCGKVRKSIDVSFGVVSGVGCIRGGTCAIRGRGSVEGFLFP